MRGYLTLTRRELAGYFLSVTGYVIIATAVFLMGLSFVVLLEKLQQEPTPLPVTEMFYITQFFWLILVVVAPVVTMRLFALEKATGTYETLMTTPVTDAQVVCAKFTAALFFYAIMWLPLLGCIYIVRHYSAEPGALDAGALGGTFFGILLFGGLFLSLGCLASAISRSQVAASMIGLAFCASVFLVGYMVPDKVASGSGWQARIMATIDIFKYMHDFARGVVDTRAVVLLMSLTFLFLFMTLRIVESRRWK